MLVIAQAKTPLLVRSEEETPASAASFVIGAAAAGIDGIRSPGGKRWRRVMPPPGPANSWDTAHMYVTSVAAQGKPMPYAEPDFLQMHPRGQHIALLGRGAQVHVKEGTASPPSDLDSNWPPSLTDGAAFDWHAGDGFSQLRKARQAIGNAALPRRVRIGHLDTGYSESHESCPIHLLREAAWSFVENEASAVDPASYSGGLDNPGHGTATLALLAGNRCSITSDYLGGAPGAEIVPVRIANSVVHFMTNSMAGGIHHAVGWGCDVISVSMGGLPAQSWADEVNAAYEAGCVICAASGDSLGGLPTHFTVYPARFRRTLSACGVTFAGLPYFDAKFNLNTSVLEGSFGPDAAMNNALSTYTPNVPWALIHSPVDGYSRAGGGTSAATPQIAAAAALYVQKYLPTLMTLQGWQRVEAIRNALFSSAARTADFSHLGRGVLRAADALNVPVNAELPKTPPDTIDFALLKELFGWEAFSTAQQQMLMVEAAQLATSSATIQEAVQSADMSTNALSTPERKVAIAALASAPQISQTLKRFLMTAGARL